MSAMVTVIQRPKNRSPSQLKQQPTNRIQVCFRKIILHCFVPFSKVFANQYLSMFFVKFCGNVSRKLLEVSKPASIGTTAEDAERSVVDQLSNLFIRSSPPSAPTQVPPPVTDYMPNQFGSYSGSSYTSSRYAHNS